MTAKELADLYYLTIRLGIEKKAEELNIGLLKNLYIIYRNKPQMALSL